MPTYPEIPLDTLKRPCGLQLLWTRVDSLAPLQKQLALDVRLWMRWAEPVDTGLEDARVEIAVSTARDEERRAARVIARTSPLREDGARKIYGALERQGLVDLLVFGPELPNGSLPVLGPLTPDGKYFAYLHLLLCADLTRRSVEHGLPTAPFPQQYE